MILFVDNFEAQTARVKRSFSPVPYISDNNAEGQKKGMFHINLSNWGQS